MSRKTLTIGILLGLIIVLASGYFLPLIILNQRQTNQQSIDGQNPIFCYAVESATSSWQKEIGCPVLSTYAVGTPNSSLLPNANVGISVTNNNSISLFNVVITVTYRTNENNWNTTEKFNMGFLDIAQSKHAKITLINPSLLLWDTKRPQYTREGTLWENVTVFVLNATDCKITAYGFAKP